MLTRRLFLAGAVAAPAIVRASSLMKIWVPPEPKVWVGVDPGAGDDVFSITLGSRQAADRACGLHEWQLDILRTYDRQRKTRMEAFSRDLMLGFPG